MEIKYSVFNPVTGLPALYDTREEALQAFWDIVLSYVYLYMGNRAYTKIEILENGSERYFDDNDGEITQSLSIAEIEDLIVKHAQNQQVLAQLSATETDQSSQT